MRILVCGGITYSNKEMVFKTLSRVHLRNPVTLVIEGGERGADFWGGYWADQSCIPHLRIPADWKKYGRGAVIRRNLKIISYQPKLLVAFPGGPETENLVRFCLQNKILVQRVRDQGFVEKETEDVEGCTESIHEGET